MSYFLGDVEECDECGKPFEVREHHLQMPGTKEREAIVCPHCNHIVGERISNGWWNTNKLTKDQEKEYFDQKSKKQHP